MLLFFISYFDLLEIFKEVRKDDGLRRFLVIGFFKWLVEFLGG